MSTLSKQMQTYLMERLAVIYVVFLTVNSLGSSMLIALVGTKISGLDFQTRVELVVGMAVNWTGSMMPLVIKAMQQVDKGTTPIPTLPTDNSGNTTQLTKAQAGLTPPTTPTIQ